MTVAQHLNLLDDALRPRREPFSSVDGLRLLAVLAVVLVLADVGLHFAADREARAAQAARQQLTALQSGPRARGPEGQGASPAAELAALQGRYASTQQMRSAIQSGAAGNAQGYAQYLLALARQSRNTGPQALWITDFSVAPDSGALDLQGRMTDPRVLPDYLRRLNEEPLFRGHAFAQLDMKAMPMPGDLDNGAGAAALPGVTEFSLRASAGAQSASPFSAAGGQK